MYVQSGLQRYTPAWIHVGLDGLDAKRKLMRRSMVWFPLCQQVASMDSKTVVTVEFFIAEAEALEGWLKELHTRGQLTRVHIRSASPGIQVLASAPGVCSFLWMYRMVWVTVSGERRLLSNAW